MNSLKKGIYIDAKKTFGNLMLVGLVGTEKAPFFTKDGVRRGERILGYKMNAISEKITGNLEILTKNNKNYSSLQVGDNFTLINAKVEVKSISIRGTYERHIRLICEDVEKLN